MPGVPYTFGTATTSIPLSNLDSNFQTPVTIGNASVALGNTITTIGNITLTNVTISSVSTPLTIVEGGTGLNSVGANATVLTSNGTAAYWTTAGFGAVANNAIYINSNNINVNYTFPTGYNGESVGPISIASGNVVTVSSGCRWVVL